jgi:hypothetical protein
MKKYFIAETDEELVFGDTIELDLTKKTMHGSHTIEGAIKFSELSLPLLLEIGAVEEREVEEEEDNTPEDNLIDFGDETPCEALEALEEDFEALEERVESLEQEIRQLKGMHKDYVALTHKMLDTFKEFVFSLSDKEKKKNAQPKKK